MCFYFSHLVINNFIYQITVNVGGNESDTGGILALAAIVELPAMIFFTQLKERFSTKGGNRGHGLLLVKRILDEDKIITSKTEITKKLYIQKIIINNENKDQ